MKFWNANVKMSQEYIINKVYIWWWQVSSHLSNIHHTLQKITDAVWMPSFFSEICISQIEIPK